MSGPTNMGTCSLFPTPDQPFEPLSGLWPLASGYRCWLAALAALGVGEE